MTADLERRKIELEIRTLQQSARHRSITLCVSIIGAILILAGLVFERMNTYDQRRFQFEATRFDQRLERMSTIASEYDRLFGETTGVLERNRTRTWQLITHIGLLHQRLRDLDTNDQELLRLKTYVGDVYGNLADAKVTVDEWADAMQLEAVWKAKSKAPSPDFSQLFGDDLLSKWQAVPPLALAALEAEYSMSGSHSRQKLESFRDAGAAFQTHLYVAISRAADKGP